MEYLDVLDGEGNVTGEKVLRTEAHARGIWHNTVHIYLFRKRNNQIELLVHLRAKTKDSSPNTWDIRFGGHVKAGETIEEAVVSEVEEEIGLSIKSQDLLFGGKVIHNGETNKEHISVFFYNFEGDVATLVFNDGEVEEVRWVSPSKIVEESHKNPELWGGKKEEGFKRVLDMLDKALETGG